ncbi:MAG: single-stranded-DNA-specific exonuclease RecJ [bacterium]|nr:single-stranded-DNA-specific exonuclease RecJ [bacterium]
METKWIIKPPIDKKLCETFPEHSPLILQLLYNRGLTTQETIDEFFSPDYKNDIHDPYLLKGMKKAVERIYKAIEKKEKILIYGDYDADGVTSSVLIIKTLKFLRAKKVSIYIPDRAKEGYGLNKEAIEQIKKTGVSLIITVDCGIASWKEVELANSLGIDVIVTDHHWVPDKLPKSLAIINPKQKGDKYPFKNLAGVGVAFKLSQALLSNQKPKQNSNSAKTSLSFEKWLLDLVAVGTVADSVPLLGENRTLLNYGLIVLGKTKNLGLSELIKKIKASKSASSGKDQALKIDSDTIGYQISPRINAAGRMDHANTSFELLITESAQEAQGLVASLELLNAGRQSLTEKIIKQIRERIGKNPSEKIIFEGDSAWPVGILGLIAGKLADEYSRPVFIYNKGENFSGGSCRSIPSFDVIESLSRSKSLLSEFGGHKSAAGFKVENKNLEKLKKEIAKIASREIKNEELIPSIEIDAEIEIKNIDWTFFEKVEKIAPYGEANPEPAFLLRDMKITEMRAVGNGEKHLKLSMESSLEKGKKFQAIGFNFGEWSKKLKLGSLIDIVFILTANHWNGHCNLEFKIIDLKTSKK